MKTHIFSRRLASTLLALLTSATMAWAQGQLPTMGDGTENNPYLINTAEDWNNLADYVEAGNDCDSLFFMMTDNIGTIDEPITKTMGCQTIKDDSNSRKRFAGIFDGDNHTLTISLTSAATNKNYCAPFAYVKHATIKNLHVAGALTATGQFASGLVGSSGNNRKDGNCIIQNCQVSVEITANYISNNGRYGNHGGFIGIAEGTATIENSWFDGKFPSKRPSTTAGSSARTCSAPPGS